MYVCTFLDAFIPSPSELVDAEDRQLERGWCPVRTKVGQVTAGG
jgi:hypothetical protein